MMRRLRALLRSPRRLETLCGLGWMGPFAARRELWRLERPRVAVGLAIGGFFGIMLPLGQALLAVAMAIIVPRICPPLCSGRSSPIPSPSRRWMRPPTQPAQRFSACPLRYPRKALPRSASRFWLERRYSRSLWQPPPG